MSRTQARPPAGEFLLYLLFSASPTDTDETIEFTAFFEYLPFLHFPLAVFTL
jgi:hypothetical protein